MQYEDTYLQDEDTCKDDARLRDCKAMVLCLLEERFLIKKNKKNAPELNKSFGLTSVKIGHNCPSPMKPAHRSIVINSPLFTIQTLESQGAKMERVHPPRNSAEARITREKNRT